MLIEIWFSIIKYLLKQLNFIFQASKRIIKFRSNYNLISSLFSSVTFAHLKILIICIIVLLKFYYCTILTLWSAIIIIYFIQSYLQCLPSRCAIFNLRRISLRFIFLILKYFDFQVFKWLLLLLEFFPQQKLKQNLSPPTFFLVNLNLFLEYF